MTLCILILFDISPAFHCWHDCLLIFSLFLESMTHLFWNFHSFCPLFFCLLWRCLFWLLLNKRALQVYSSRSFTLCVCVYVCVCVCTKSLQLCHTLCNPMDHSLPGSSNHGILQVRILEWVTMPSSRVFSWLRNYESCIGRQFFTSIVTWEALFLFYTHCIKGQKYMTPKNEFPQVQRYPIFYWGRAEENYQ